MRRRTFLLLAPLALARCETPAYYPITTPAPAPVGPSVSQPMPQPFSSNRRIALLVPLTGPHADFGTVLQQAAQLAVAVPGAPALDVRDTGGTPQGAAEAARAAIAGGAGIIIGPLLSAETAAVAPIARAANVAILAFTNDPAQAQPGVWTLGITPGQQVRRLVAAVQAQGRNQIAALLPDEEFGHALGDALTRTAAADGLPPPQIAFHEPGMDSINATTRILADYANRRGPIQAQIDQAKALGTPEGRKQAAELARTPIPPPGFSALLLGDTGEALAEVAAMLPYYDVNRSQVQFLGPSGWAAPGSGSAQMEGAWFAAPDPAARAGLEQAFAGKYGAPPPPVADLAFDAASIARVVGASGGFSVLALTQPAGFIGADGWLALQPDGQVRRGLAVFRIERGGPQIIEPAPQSRSTPGT